MPNLKDIRTRIASVKNTKKITSAMKMVSVAKLRRAQDAAEAARPYALKMQSVIGSLVSRVEEDAHPLLKQRAEPARALVIVISSDRGLCGGFNANLFRALDAFLKDRKAAGIEVEIATVGRKAHVNYQNEDVEIVKNYTGIIGDVSFAKAKEIATDAKEGFVEGTYDLVYVLFNEFVSAISYNTTMQHLLPLSVEDFETDDDAGEYIFEPGEDELLGQLLPTHIDVQVLRALLEAEASEHGSRMAAMENATNNASDMIQDLTLQYNRARQAYITKELMEIVSGSEALKG